ncbi:MAG TPA: YlxR family protein [Anaerolineales bacterium]|nr:YlxR family protein [Anaerolineales bacterium]
MVRIVRTADGVQMDPTGKLSGRGAYLHDRRECWERGLKGALSHALKTTLSQADRARLEDFMNSLPANAEADVVGAGE